mmetsp:Transcript_18506/g.55254  ORF Transcript_18506/g.55254 Transcript_18506/m.55254 type:complete len:239 (-) Transcript_18506:558-1274(-)
MGGAAEGFEVAAAGLDVAAAGAAAAARAAGLGAPSQGDGCCGCCASSWYHGGVGAAGHVERFAAACGLPGGLARSTVSAAAAAAALTSAALACDCGAAAAAASVASFSFCCCSSLSSMPRMLPTWSMMRCMRLGDSSLPPLFPPPSPPPSAEACCMSTGASGTFTRLGGRGATATAPAAAGPVTFTGGVLVPFASAAMAGFVATARPVATRASVAYAAASCARFASTWAAVIAAVDAA